jgi:hypothetical protein
LGGDGCASDKPARTIAASSSDSEKKIVLNLSVPLALARVEKDGVIMRKLTGGVILLTLATASWAQGEQVDPLWIDSLVATGVARDEALRRYSLDAEARRLKETLETNEAASFGGIYGDASDGTMKIFVRLTGDAKTTLSRYTTNPAFVAVNTNVPLRALENRKNAIIRSLEARKVMALTSLDLRNGRVQVVARRAAEARAAIGGAAAEGSDYEIKEADPIPSPTAAVLGGNELTHKRTSSAGGVSYDRASAGFSVSRTVNGVTTYGVLTAAHFGRCLDTAGAVIAGCTVNGPAYYNPTKAATITSGTPTLAWQGERLGGDYDFEWRTSSSDTFPNQITYGSSPMTITATYDAYKLVPGSSRVCKMGRSSGATCGIVTQFGTFNNFGSVGEYVIVQHDDPSQFMALAGDSGGPVIAFTGYATGLVQGNWTDPASPVYRHMAFMPIARISVLGLTVRTQ